MHGHQNVRVTTCLKMYDQTSVGLLFCVELSPSITLALHVRYLSYNPDGMCLLRGTE